MTDVKNGRILEGYIKVISSEVLVELNIRIIFDGVLTVVARINLNARVKCQMIPSPRYLTACDGCFRTLTLRGVQGLVLTGK